MYLHCCACFHIIYQQQLLSNISFIFANVFCIKHNNSKIFKISCLCNNISLYFVLCVFYFKQFTLLNHLFNMINPY